MKSIVNLDIVAFWLQKQIILFQFYNLILKVLARHLDKIEMKAVEALFCIFAVTL